jgi:monoterpene epsilon-lactone hydrolase
VSSEALQQVMEVLAQSRPPAGTPVEKVRELMAMLASLFEPETGVTVEETQEGPAGEWLIPEQASEDHALLYLHGGGFVLGSPAVYRHLTTRLAQAARMRTLVPDYRLAPEHPFPAGLDDAVAAYEHLLASGREPEQIAVAGDSAGGGLTVSLLLACKERGLPMPGAALLFSPWLDLAGTGESTTERASRDPLIRPEDLLRYAELYLDGKKPDSPLASPLCGDLSGLPPTTVYVGTEEVLFDDSERFVAAARQAGVRVTYSVGERMPHVWPYFAPMLPEGVETLIEAGAALRTTLDRDAAPA